MPVLISLFLNFSKFSLLCFGGGYILIPLLFDEFVHRQALLTAEQFGNLISIAQVTPGPVGLNTATYVGFFDAGVPGAVFATFGLIFPTLILSSTAVYGLNRWKETFFIKALMKGTRLAAVAMILYAVTIFFGMSVFSEAIPWDEIIKMIFLQDASIPNTFKVSHSGIIIFLISIFMSVQLKMSSTEIILQSALLGAALHAI